MGRIEALFQKKSRNILNVYCTAGFPKLDSTLEVMKALAENGADLIELGIPYSDPLADGPVIQASSSKAIANGMTISKLLAQLNDFRKDIHLPVVLMGYLNPVLQFGFEKFCSEVSRIGIDGLIIPDLPIFEFEKVYGSIIRNYGLDFIFLFTPETSIERIKRVDTLSTGFLYAVSSSSLTGSDKDFGQVEKYLEKVQQLHLKNPVLVGFGIKDHTTFAAANRHANGAIIGSAYIRVLEGQGDIRTETRKFLEGLRFGSGDSGSRMAGTPDEPGQERVRWKGPE